MPNHPRPRRSSLRLPPYDYSQAGAYFITGCTPNRVVLFGKGIDCDVQLVSLCREKGGFETRPAAARDGS
jgi:hypothetical protein